MVEQDARQRAWKKGVACATIGLCSALLVLYWLATLAMDKPFGFVIFVSVLSLTFATKYAVDCITHKEE